MTESASPVPGEKTPGIPPGTERLADLWRDLLEAVERNQGPIHVHKLTGSSKAFLAAHLRRMTKRPVLVVTPGEDRAEAFENDLSVLLDERVYRWAGHPTSAYEVKHSHTEGTAARLETLTHLLTAGDGTVVASAPALMDLVAGPQVLERHLVRLATGDALDLDDMTIRLTYLGYNRSAAVEEVGDYALRGGILDVYSLGEPHPIRIEIEYDTVASIREFDVHTQRSRRRLESAVIIPRHELFLDQDGIDRAVAELTALDPEAGRELDEAFATELHPAGIERMAARLHQDLGPLSRYLPAGALVLVVEPDQAARSAERCWEEIEAAHAEIKNDFPHMSSPSDLFLTPAGLVEDLGRFLTLRLSDFTPETADARNVSMRSSPPETFGRRIDLWRKYLNDLRDTGYETVLFCDNEGQRTRLVELLVEEGVGVDLVLGVLSEGFLLPEARLAVLTDHEFFGRPRRRTRRRRFRSGFGLKELQSLKRGSFVVHIDHGVGRYLGLTRLEVNGHMTDVMQLEYHGKDKLYVPVDQLDLIQRYSSEEGKIPGLSRLGGTGWSKAKTRAKKAIKEMAGELVRLYAQRKAHPGHAFAPDTPWQRELEGSFPFEETPDQAKAVEVVKEDMENTSPMDRLICGDVGYGKTEVAVRAAFKAIQEGKQVAMLVPTTILAEQHFNTFRERFSGFPVTVDMLSRFRSAKERAEILTRLTDGRLDLVIGTHALLGKKVKLKNLGLLIVDEEQRFGVAHKERLKKLKLNVDVLTLTATPIPRTLNLSMLGVRDITVIQTPPEGRMPVQTEIADFDRDLIQEALLREADRGGQSFFVHNRIHSIQSIGAYVERLCPQLRVAVAHGRLPERELERVMHEFTSGRIDVLVATMIIENGLDIPSVNTMIVNRSDAFGLSQLYQLRGRIGRSNRKAFCYFLVPSHRVLTEFAMKRLRAIAEFDELGSGFALAMRDLEIRGSGNILGAEQSGHIVTVGFEMYCRLVDEAVRELKGLPLVERPEPRLTTDVDAFLSDEYVEDAEEKVGFYKRLAEAGLPEEIDGLEEELEDRFGRLPREARAMFALRRIRTLGAEVGAASIYIRNNRIELEFDPPPTPDRLKRWMQNISHPVEFATSGRFLMKQKGGVPETLGLLRGMVQENTRPEPVGKGNPGDS